ncbi:Crp/Fnr family transcriptional regulator [Aquiflexum gelatinilyticum]|uniref:Crp/Fnr family transcriptional regulator n=1 Tax=Aquiflexum gelatinilyticum TaxID=2961943 RepID=A0A9X2P998_9BACT|nr:Crp/Fnr family transcriptional regulator [Aquiflexum gelatinilyticum]MCR9015569.1 Crp/Fnr family transcriptional regulator [Aquiflexum gelatinilyticum]
MHEVLKSYFHNLTKIEEEKLESLSPYFKEKKVKKNEFLLKEGEVCKFNYFVISGCLRLFSVNNEGFENTRYIAFEGKFGTSFTSLITGQPSIEYIQALEKSTLLYISKEDFYFLVENEPSVNKIYRNILESAYITTQRRIYDFQGTDSLERLRSLIYHQPKILSRISHKIIASYLGITHYTLSRLKAQL